MSLYKVAELILSKAADHKGSVKNLVFASKYRNVKQLYALVCETLKYSTILEDIIAQSKFLTHVKGMKKPLAKLLIYDFLFGKGIQCSGKLKQTITSRKSMLQSALARIKIKKKVIKNEDLIEENFLIASIPKYLRVNTLKTTIEDVMNQFKGEGYALVKVEWNGLGMKEFMIDEHIDNLLIFHGRTDFHKHTLYLNGFIIFQDKASCFPAQILSPASNSHVIDACAAPGNKTSHMASLMKNTGLIFAFDIDAKRINTMETLLARAGVKNCEVLQSSFLKVSPKDAKYENVQCILVDPSCSGSGIVSRLSHLTDDSNSNSSERLRSLSRFQLSILNHALSFPHASRVVYSTCSLHDIENENVTKQALMQNPDFTLEKCMSSWPRRGNFSEDFIKGSDKCVRCNPELDGTNGFFVALFVRNVFAQKPKAVDNSSGTKQFVNKSSCPHKKRKTSSGGHTRFK